MSPRDVIDSLEAEPSDLEAWLTLCRSDAPIGTLLGRLGSPAHKLEALLRLWQQVPARRELGKAVLFLLGLEPSGTAGADPAEWWLTQGRAGRNGTEFYDLSTGLPLHVRRSADGAQMILVAEGLFTRGTSQLECEMVPGSAHPAREVFTDAFYLDVTPITVRRYARFLQEQGVSPRDRSQAEDHPAHWDRQLARPDRPVVCVNWFAAASYARWAGRDCRPKPSGRRRPGGRMPGPIHGELPRTSTSRLTSTFNSTRRLSASS